MSLAFETLKNLYNQCRVDESLDPDDQRNLNLDELPGEVRGCKWAARLVRRIRLHEGPACLFFSGLRGSGKSTELKRAMQMLAREDGFLPVYVDAVEHFDLANPMDIPDILAAVLNRADEEVLKLEGRNPEEALTQGYLARLWEWLKTTDVEFQKVEWQIPSGPKLVAEMKDRPGLRERVRSTLASHLPHFLRQVQDHLILLQGRCVGQRRKGLVIVLDSLEKNRGTSGTWQEVINSLERIFGQGAPYLRLPVHAIYTVPPPLVPLLEPASVEFLPMVKLHDQLGHTYAAGQDAMRQIVLRRFKPTELEALLGDAWESRLQRILNFSGGYTREVVRMLRQVCLEETLPLSEGAFNRLFNNLQEEYRQAIPADLYPFLVQVAKTRFMAPDTESTKFHASRLLDLNAIFRYQNEQRWFDLHPAVRGLPGIQSLLTHEP